MAKSLGVARPRTPSGFAGVVVFEDGVEETHGVVESMPAGAGTIDDVGRRGQFVPWRTAGRVTEQQTNADEVVQETGWVFNNETGSGLDPRAVRAHRR